MTTPYINGQMIEVDPAAMTPVVNPASGKAFSRVFMARPEHMTRAIDAAWAVRDVWGNTLPSERELILFRAADVLESISARRIQIEQNHIRHRLRRSPGGGAKFRDRIVTVAIVDHLDAKAVLFQREFHQENVARVILDQHNLYFAGFGSHEGAFQRK